jgi:hypothetical protein
MKRLFTVGTALLVIVLTAFGCASPGGEGWGETLINGGKGLENFNRIGDADWRAEDGAIVGTKGKGGYLVSKKSYKGFDLYVEFWPMRTPRAASSYVPPIPRKSAPTAPTK